MSNELDRLAEAFKSEEPILPREEARKATIAAAMAQFDEENQKASQGIPSAERLKGQGNSLLETLRRRISMTFSNQNLTYILTGSASLAAMAIVVLNTGLIPDLNRTDEFALSPAITSSDDAKSRQSTHKKAPAAAAEPSAVARFRATANRQHVLGITAPACCC